MQLHHYVILLGCGASTTYAFALNIPGHLTAAAARARTTNAAGRATRARCTTTSYPSSSSTWLMGSTGSTPGREGNLEHRLHQRQDSTDNSVKQKIQASPSMSNNATVLSTGNMTVNMIDAVVSAPLLAQGTALVAETLVNTDAAYSVLTPLHKWMMSKRRVAAAVEEEQREAQRAAVADKRKRATAGWQERLKTVQPERPQALTNLYNALSEAAEAPGKLAESVESAAEKIVAAPRKVKQFAEEIASAPEKVKHFAEDVTTMAATVVELPQRAARALAKGVEAYESLRTVASVLPEESRRLADKAAVGLVKASDAYEALPTTLPTLLETAAEDAQVVAGNVATGTAAGLEAAAAALWGALAELGGSTVDQAVRQALLPIHSQHMSALRVSAAINAERAALLPPPPSQDTEEMPNTALELAAVPGKASDEVAKDVSGKLGLRPRLLEKFAAWRRNRKSKVAIMEDVESRGRQNRSIGSGSDANAGVPTPTAQPEMVKMAVATKSASSGVIDGAAVVAAGLERKKEFHNLSEAAGNDGLSVIPPPKSDRDGEGAKGEPPLLGASAAVQTPAAASAASAALRETFAVPQSTPPEDTQMSARTMIAAGHSSVDIQSSFSTLPSDTDLDTVSPAGSVVEQEEATRRVTPGAADVQGMVMKRAFYSGISNTDAEATVGGTPSAKPKDIPAKNPFDVSGASSRIQSVTDVPSQELAMTSSSAVEASLLAPSADVCASPGARIVEFGNAPAPGVPSSLVNESMSSSAELTATATAAEVVATRMPVGEVSTSTLSDAALSSFTFSTEAATAVVVGSAAANLNAVSAVESVLDTTPAPDADASVAKTVSTSGVANGTTRDATVTPIPSLPAAARAPVEPSNTILTKETRVGTGDKGDREEDVSTDESEGDALDVIEMTADRPSTRQRENDPPAPATVASVANATAATATNGQSESNSELEPRGGWGVTNNPAADFLRRWMDVAVPEKRARLKEKQNAVCWERQWYPVAIVADLPQSWHGGGQAVCVQMLGQKYELLPPWSAVDSGKANGPAGKPKADFTWRCRAAVATDTGGARLESGQEVPEIPLQESSGLLWAWADASPRGLAAAKLTQPPNLATSSDGSTAATSDGEGDVTRTRPWRRLIRRRQRERGTTGGRRRAQDGRHRRAELIERDVPHAYTDVLRGLLSPAHGSAVRAAAAATPLAETGGPVFTATADVPLVSAGNSGFEVAYNEPPVQGQLSFTLPAAIVWRFPPLHDDPETSGTIEKQRERSGERANTASGVTVTASEAAPGTERPARSRRWLRWRMPGRGGDGGRGAGDGGGGRAEFGDERRERERRQDRSSEGSGSRAIRYVAVVLPVDSGRTKIFARLEMEPAGLMESASVWWTRRLRRAILAEVVDNAAANLNKLPASVGDWVEGTTKGGPFTL